MMHIQRYVIVIT